MNEDNELKTLLESADETAAGLISLSSPYEEAYQRATRSFDIYVEGSNTTMMPRAIVTTSTSVQ